MLTPITTLALPGLIGSFPPPGVVPPVGPVVVMSFTLPMAGPPPNIIQPPVPQTCQNSTPNVALRVLVVDQDGVAVDLSTVNLVQLWLLAPDQSKKPVAAALVSNGLDGLLEALTDPDTLPQAGTWGIQAQLQFGGNILETRWGYFAVLPNVVDF
jgi:hypothetical protein